MKRRNEGSANRKPLRMGAVLAPCLLFSLELLYVHPGFATMNTQKDFGAVIVGDARELTIETHQDLTTISIRMKKGVDFGIDRVECDNSKAICSIQSHFTPLSGGVKQDTIDLVGVDGKLMPLIALSGLGLCREAVQIPKTVSSTPVFSAETISPNVPQLSSLVRDAFGNFYFSDSANHTVDKYDPSTRTIEIYAGTGASGFNGDGFGLRVALNSPSGLAIDQIGNLYIADTGNHLVRRIDSDHRIQTIVSFSALKTKSTNAPCPRSLSSDRVGDIFVSDSCRGVVVKIDSDGNSSLFAGDGTSPGIDALGDGELATESSLLYPAGIAIAENNDVYIADSGHNEVRVVRATDKRIYRVAGNGNAGRSGDGGPALSSELYLPVFIAVTAGNLLIVDSPAESVRAVSMISGRIKTIVNPSPQAEFASLAEDPDGNVFVWDRASLCVKQLGFAIQSNTALATIRQSHPEELLTNGGFGNGKYTFTSTEQTGQLRFEPASLLLKPSVQSSLTISNVGQFPSRIRGISVSAKADVQTTCGAQLAPGDSCTITLTVEEAIAPAHLSISTASSTAMIPILSQ